MRKAIMAGGFVDALLAAPIPVIAEIKARASDGTDLLRGRPVAEIVAAYRAGGAPCLSVVTGSWFGGSDAMLEETVRHAGVPVLKKDFITREDQIRQAAGAGAAAVLLTARLLPRSALCHLAEAARRHGVTAFVEASSEKELDGLRLDPGCVVAVNNKDIARRERDAGDIGRSLSLLPLVRRTGTRCPVSASGIGTAEDAARLIAAGYGGVLVGTGLLKSGDIAGWFAALAKRMTDREATDRRASDCRASDCRASAGEAA
ncbi:indole-3-glycerol-phosphate synthase [Roseomonas genomospecies 6]|uniref:indole-3-glycerol-phosphate synthase n=2 Tax=Roseomonas genomospecies 6 TaxID=214106 RepID=A0A9W7TZ40_9PROT|nr:indole-3-glycerol-phosphate synthase [Roseomonas genomospecies 6]KAA0680767.1 indole-3-glycerol-phosphate synthase [Roseomonas genomospecies 6]